MIWKWVSGILLVGILAYVLIVLVPDLRSRTQKSESDNVMLSDSLKTVLASLSQKVNALNSIDRSYQRREDRAASVLPTVTLQVQGLTALAQHQENLEAMIRAGLLRPADTAGRGELVSYSRLANQAMTIARRVADSLRVSDSLLRKAHSALQFHYKVRGDSLSELHTFTTENQFIASQKGWFTGRNQRLRRRSQHPPL